jgi:hypothetical protein
MGSQELFAQAGPELMTILPQHPKYWDYSMHHHACQFISSLLTTCPEQLEEIHPQPMQRTDP